MELAHRTPGEILLDFADHFPAAIADLIEADIETVQLAVAELRAKAGLPYRYNSEI